LLGSLAADLKIVTAHPHPRYAQFLAMDGHLHVDTMGRIKRELHAVKALRFGPT